MILEMFLAAVVWRVVEEVDLKAIFKWARGRVLPVPKRAALNEQAGSE